MGAVSRISCLKRGVASRRDIPVQQLARDANTCLGATNVDAGGDETAGSGISVAMRSLVGWASAVLRVRDHFGSLVWRQGCEVVAVVVHADLDDVGEVGVVGEVTDGASAR